MKTFSLATLFLPEWVLPWVGVFGIIAWIVGARTLGMAAAIFLLAELVLAPLLSPWLSTLPGWALFLIGGVMVLLVLHGFIDVLFGKETAGHVSGTYLIRLLDFLFLGPFRLLGHLLRALTRLG